MEDGGAGGAGAGAAGSQLVFNRFLELMNGDGAKDLVRRINTFMKDLRQRAPSPDEDSRLVQAFLEEMDVAMRGHPLFAPLPPADREAAGEALEKYLMTKLHDRVFGTGPEDAERDALLAARCEALAFVGPEHLEVSPGAVTSDGLDRAARELARAAAYKAPRDKLVCVLNCCRVLGDMLHAASAAAAAAGDGGGGSATAASAAGADDFTPALILAVLRARVPRLASNIAYIERYRLRARMAGEAAYYFVQLCSAAGFIEMADAGSLHGVSADEFLARLLQAGALSDEQLALISSGGSGNGGGGARNSSSGGAAAAGPQSQQQQQDGVLRMNALMGALPPPPPPPAAATPPAPPSQQPQPLPTVAQLEERGACILAAAGGAGGAARLSARHPFVLAPLEALALADVGRLLTAYKELALRYESLVAGVESWAAGGAGSGGDRAADPLATQGRQQQQQQQQAAAVAAAPALLEPQPGSGLSPLASPGAAPEPAARPAAGNAAASATAQAFAVPAPAPLPGDVLAELVAGGDDDGGGGGVEASGGDVVEASPAPAAAAAAAPAPPAGGTTNTTASLIDL